MISFDTVGRAYYWHVSVSQYHYKVSWPLDEYLAYMRVAKSEAELRSLSIERAVITEMTTAEIAEVTGLSSESFISYDPQVTIRAKAAAVAAGASRSTIRL